MLSSNIAIRVQVYNDRGLRGQLFLLVEAQRFPDKIPETAVIAALDGELIAVGVVDFFNVAGGRTQHPQRQVRLSGRLLAQ